MATAHQKKVGNQVILKVRPSQGLKGTVRVPGDKSISHRAALLGAIAQGETRIDGFLESADCLVTLRCLQALGVSVKHLGPGAYEIAGRGTLGFQEPTDVLNCGNSGTTMRLLAGILAAQPIFSVLTGDESLRSRPMARVVEPLRSMGARIYGREGNAKAPLAIVGTQKLKGIAYELPKASAQVKSAILLAGLLAAGETVIREPAPSRNHTELMLQHLGVPVVSRGLKVVLPGGFLPRGSELSVPGDISSAAFLLVAAAILPESDLVIEDVGINPTRAGVLYVLKAMGANLEILEEKWQGEPRADIRIRSSRLRGVEIGGSTIPSLIDELPVIAVAAAFAEGTTVIRDAAELRVKECDRIAVMARELTRLGVDISERSDGWRIKGGRKIHGGEAHGAGDHRIVMALAVLGLGGSNEVSIRGAEAVGISYPGFAKTLRQLGADVEEVEYGIIHS